MGTDLTSTRTPLRGIWAQLVGALVNAQDWTGLPFDNSRLADLASAVVQAGGDTSNFEPKIARDLCAFLDPRSARVRDFFSTDGKKESGQSAVRGLRAILQPRAGLWQPVQKFAETVPQVASRERAGRGVRRSVPERDRTTASFSPASPQKTDKTLYEYQAEDAGDALRAMQRAADPLFPWIIGAPKDRGFQIAPWQTGKSFSSAALARRARDIFPGRQTLVISPLNIVTRQMVSDMRDYSGGSVSIFHERRKNLEGDTIVGSAWTLVNHLDEIDPGRIGLVIVDEMLSILTPTYLKILERLGFIDSEGRLTDSRGKFVLGLGPTGERGDGGHIRSFFRDTRISARGYNWFIDKKLLHGVEGVEIPIGTLAGDWELAKDAEEGEGIVNLRMDPRNIARAVEAYRRYFDGMKIIIFASRVREAEAIAARFNSEMGPGFASAVTNETPVAEEIDILDRFNKGTGPTVLAGIKKFAAGARMKGVGGILFTYRTDSWNFFASGVGRALGKEPGEDWRRIRVGTFYGGGMPLTSFQTVATMLGNFEDVPIGEIYRVEDLKEGGRKHSGTRYAHKRGAFRSKLRIGMDKATELDVKAFAFGSLVRQILRDEFGGDIVAFSAAADVSERDVKDMCRGILPDCFADVFNIVRGLQGVSRKCAGLPSAWLSDMGALLEALHPLVVKGDGGNVMPMPPAQRRLTQLARGAILRMATGGSLCSIAIDKRDDAVSEGLPGLNYDQLSRAFRGDFPKSAKDMYPFYEMIIASAVADESDVRRAIGEYVRERIEAGDRIPDPYELWTDGARGQELVEVFDSTYVDVMDASQQIRFTLGAEDGFFTSAGVFAGKRPEDMPVSRDSPAGALFLADLSRKIDRSLSTLTSWEERILRMRFGLVKGRYDEDMSLEDVGQVSEVTRERVRQQEAKALRKMRHPSRRKRFDIYHKESDAPARADDIDVGRQRWNAAPAWDDARCHLWSTAPYLDYELTFVRLERMVSNAAHLAPFKALYDRLFELRIRVGDEKIETKGYHRGLGLLDLMTAAHWLRYDVSCYDVSCAKRQKYLAARQFPFALGAGRFSTIWNLRRMGASVFQAAIDEMGLGKMRGRLHPALAKAIGLYISQCGMSPKTPIALSSIAAYEFMGNLGTLAPAHGPYQWTMALSNQPLAVTIPNMPRLI